MQRIQYSLFVFTIAIVTTVVATPSFGAQAPPAEGSESDLIAVLGSDAEIFDKAKACQQLAVIGTKECVPALAKLLTDDIDEVTRTYVPLAAKRLDSLDEAICLELGDCQGQYRANQNGGR